MFDIGWSEMAVIALIALLVIGPKELPHAMRTMGQWMRKARAITREFQSGINEMIREAELEDAKKALDASKNIGKTIIDTVDPTGSVEKDLAEVEEQARKTDPDQAPEKPRVQPLPGGKAPPAGGKVESPDLPAADGTPAGHDGADHKDEAAKVVKTPAQVAPPHSVTPPADGFAGKEREARAEPAEAGDAPKQSA